MSVPTRAPLDEEGLRLAKDVLVEGIAETQERMGLARDIRAAEDFAMASLRRVSVDHEEDRTRDLSRVRIPPSVASGRARAPLPDDVREVARPLGEFRWNLDDNTLAPISLTPDGHGLLVRLMRPARSRQQVLRERVDLLLTLYGWRERILVALEKMFLASPEEKSLAGDKVLEIVEQSALYWPMPL